MPRNDEPAERLTLPQSRRVLRLVEQGLAGEFDRLTIDFRGGAFYVDTMKRTRSTLREERPAA